LPTYAQRVSEIAVIPNCIGMPVEGYSANPVLKCFLVEYFANPARMYRKYYAEGFTANRRSVARMFGSGRVLFDRDGTVARVVRWARRTIPKPFRRPDRMARENAKYRMWDSLDGLRDLLDRRSPAAGEASRSPASLAPGFWHSYYLALDGVIEQYGRYVGAESGAPVRTWQCLTDAKYRKAHRLAPFPDRRFAALAAACMKTGNMVIAYRRLSRLVAHAHRRMGGFTVDGWLLRSKAE
jgi:hypothetical protein